MDITIPFEDRGQKKDINEKMPRIKSAFITGINPGKMDTWVRERNYDAIKKEFLSVLNRFSDKPVDRVYFEKFNYFERK